MIIRPFEMTDEPHVVDLWVQCGLAVPHNNPLRDIARKMKVNPEWFWVGEVGGVVAATCMAGYEGHRGWINYLAVQPDLQGRGYGKMLVAHAEAALKAAGCPKINMQIRATNSKVIGFYERIGYREDHVVCMGKRLIPDLPDANNCEGAPDHGARTGDR